MRTQRYRESWIYALTFTDIFHTELPVISPERRRRDTMNAENACFYIILIRIPHGHRMRNFVTRNSQPGSLGFYFGKSRVEHFIFTCYLKSFERCPHWAQSALGMIEIDIDFILLYLQILSYRRSVPMPNRPACFLPSPCLRDE